ncbi:DUF6281 family protein [Streptomyces sp. NPDC048594]|uniref:DUF6281 family protein n=1 Tax=Streptomyces sp. NPDC048594 TaxID=3365575 RepID=UPI0037119944
MRLRTRAEPRENSRRKASPQKRNEPIRLELRHGHELIGIRARRQNPPWVPYGNPLAGARTSRRSPPMPIAISSQRDAAVSPRSRQMPWYSRIVVVAAALTAACAPQGGGGEAEGSCAMAALYDGRTYTEVDNVRFTVGAALVL